MTLLEYAELCAIAGVELPDVFYLPDVDEEELGATVTKHCLSNFRLFRLMVTSETTIHELECIRKRAVAELDNSRLKAGQKKRIKNGINKAYKENIKQMELNSTCLETLGKIEAATDMVGLLPDAGDIKKSVIKMRYINGTTEKDGKEIGKIYGVSYSTFYLWLKEATNEVQKRLLLSLEDRKAEIPQALSVYEALCGNSR